MGRVNASDGLVEILKTVAGFAVTDSGTVVAHDHKCLTSGVNRALIVLNDRADHRRVVIGQNQVDWYFSAELWIRNNNDLTQARRDSDTYAQNVIDKINDNSTLGGSVTDAIVESITLESEDETIGGNHFLLETLTIKATEYLSA